MSDEKQVKAQLLNFFHKIVGKFKNDIIVKMDYVVPTYFNINPSNLEPYARDGQKESKYLMDFCIGTKVGEEIMPGLCIQVYNNLPRDMNSIHSVISSLKSKHPQARYGMLLTHCDSIPQTVLSPTASYMQNIDFIEALKPVLNSDKLYVTLESLVDVQLRSSRIISETVFNEGNVRSLRKTYS